MSDEDAPHFPRIPWPFGPAPSAEERLDRHKRCDALYRSVLPLVQDARRSLREITALGFCDDHDRRLSRAQKHLAILESDLDNWLVRKVDP